MSVEDRVIKVMVKELGRAASDIQPHLKFKEDMGVSSIRLFQLMLALQEEFQIEEDPPEEDYLKLKTVGDVIEYLKKLLGPEKAAKY